MSPRIVAGLGCRAGATAEEVLQLLRQAQQDQPAFTHLAVPHFRQGHAALRDAAGALGLPLQAIGQDALQAVQPLCPTRSAAVLRATGLASVAEACALAAAGAGATLLAPRIAAQNVTCAVAEGARP